MITWVDQLQAWTSLGSTLIALGVAGFVVLQLKQAASALRAQNVSRDIASVLAIWERLDVHWVRFRTADREEKRRFEFGQLISYYEMACSLFRDEVFSTRASRTLHEHLSEILPNMQRDVSFKTLFEALVTDENTFENIRWFCREHPCRELNREAQLCGANDAGPAVRATEVRFDDDQMWVELEDGRTLGIPLVWFPRLLHGSPEDRAKVSISASGLHWEELNEDISIAGLIAGRGDVTRTGRRAA